MNKKLIIAIIGIIAFLAILFAVYGLVLPQPISGAITTFPVSLADDLTVIGRNLRTNGEVTAVRSGNEYLLEMANSPGEYALGDTVRIMIADCLDNPACVKEIQIYGEPLTVNFDLTGIPFECPICEICEIWKDCPEITYCEEQGYILPEDCPEIEEKTIEDFTLELIITVVVSAAFGAGVGIKITRYGTKYHEHKNIRGYHDPNRMHLYQPHKKGEIAPRYSNVKNKDRKYDYIG